MASQEPILDRPGACISLRNDDCNVQDVKVHTCTGRKANEARECSPYHTMVYPYGVHALPGQYLITPACRFIPKLREAYVRLKETGVAFEVVLCSSDTSAEAFSTQLAAMPAWAALPFGSPRIQELAARFSVPTNL